MLYVLAYYLLKPLFKLLFRLKIKGQQHLPKEGPFIVASNHASYLDPILLGLAVYPQRIKFMAKAELFRIPVLNFLIKRLGAFPVQREKGQLSAVKTATQILETKGVFGIFPEGTRHKDKLGPAQLGAALVALKTKAPIIPVAIKGTNLVWPQGSRRFHFPPLTVIVGQPLEVKVKAQNWRDEAEQLTAKLMAEIKRLLES